jgi:hypothetical protein
VVLNLNGNEVLAFPNPAHGQVRFTWQETQADSVRVDVYTLTGERIAQIKDAGAGIRLVAWSTQDLAPGVYLYRVVLTVNGTEVRKGFRKLAVVK